jgi:hypothetical protein
MQRVMSRHSKRVSGGTIAAGNILELAAGRHDGRSEDLGSRKKDRDDAYDEAAPWKIVLGAF